jgi:hypothetical protein
VAKQSMFFLISVAKPLEGTQIPNHTVIAFFASLANTVEAIQHLVYRKNTPYRYLVIEEASEGLVLESRYHGWYEANSDGKY